MLNVEHYIKTFCNAWIMPSLVELQQVYLLGLTKSAELIGQKRSRTSTFCTPAERHGTLLTIVLAAQDAPPIIVPFQLMPLWHSSSETGNTRKLIASLLDSYQKKYQIIGGLQQQHQSNVSRDFTAGKFAAALPKYKATAWDPTLYVHSLSSMPELPLKSWLCGFLSFFGRNFHFDRSGSSYTRTEIRKGCW